MLRHIGVLLAVPMIASADPRPSSPSQTQVAVGSTDAHVVGGTAAQPGEWPDAVAVLGPKGSCTGTLIAPDVVLTAGHCADIEPSQVIANTVDYNAHDGMKVGVTSVTAYPSWQSSYDVSVIVLDRPLTSIKPRMLGTSCTFRGFSKAMDVHLVGFGLTEETGTGNNSHLNQAMAPVVDPDCMGPYGCNHSIQPGGEFVAGGGGTDSCFGDSGGPVYLDTPRGVVAIGAVSRGVNGAQMPCGSGGIYVRTDKIIDWIEQTTGRTVAKDDCGLDANAQDATDPGAAAGCSASNGGAGLGLALGFLAVVRRRASARRR